MLIFILPFHRFLILYHPQNRVKSQSFLRPLTEFSEFGSIIHRKVLRPVVYTPRIAEGPFLVLSIPIPRTFSRKDRDQEFLFSFGIFLDLNAKQFILRRETVKPKKYLARLVGIFFGGRRKARFLDQFDNAVKIFQSPHPVPPIFFAVKMRPEQLQEYFFFFEIGRTHIGTTLRFLFYPRVDLVSFAVDFAKIRSGQFFRFCLINFYFPPCHISILAQKAPAKKSRAQHTKTPHGAFL